MNPNRKVSDGNIWHDSPAPEAEAPPRVEQWMIEAAKEWFPDNNGAFVQIGDPFDPGLALLYEKTWQRMAEIIARHRAESVPGPTPTAGPEPRSEEEERKAFEAHFGPEPKYDPAADGMYTERDLWLAQQDAWLARAREGRNG